MLVCQPRVDTRQKDLALEVSRSIPCFPPPQLPRLITASVSPFELIGGGRPVYTKEKPDMSILLFPLLVRTHNTLYYNHKNVAKTSKKKPRKMNRSLNNRNPREPALLNATIMMVMNTYRLGIKTGACLILLSDNNDKKRKLATA